MKVLLLSRYGPLGASSRVRFYQYLPCLREQGLEIDVTPLLPDTYLLARYAGRRWGPTAILAAYSRRLAALFGTAKYDLLWIEYELFPWMPAWFESWLAMRGIPYVVDYDDAIFHRYDSHPNRWVRRLLGGKIDSVMRNASLVTAGNDYLAARARQAGARRVDLLPTCVDLERYPLADSVPAVDFTIGWIGSPATSHYLDEARGALAAVCRDGQARVALIGAHDPAWDDVPHDVIQWSAETEVVALQKLDAGIMPLPDSPWERGKCGYKLIQYMACGKPVVASPVGVNRRIVEHGVNGYLAETAAQWTEALTALKENADLRQRMGAAGRRKVETEYSVQANAQRLLDLLRAAASKTCAA